MNLELIKNHIEKYNENVVASLPVPSEDKSNISDFFCADVVGNKRFAQNFGGYPRSEIAEINAQASLATAQALLADLQDYSTGSNPNSGLTDAQIMMSHKSRYMQTPSEQVSYLEHLVHERDNVRVAQALELQQKQAAAAAARNKGKNVKVIENEPE